MLCNRRISPQCERHIRKRPHRKEEERTRVVCLCLTDHGRNSRHLCLPAFTERRRGTHEKRHLLCSSTDQIHHPCCLVERGFGRPRKAEVLRHDRTYLDARAQKRVGKREGIVCLIRAVRKDDGTHATLPLFPLLQTEGLLCPGKRQERMAAMRRHKWQEAVA